jgi:hypothetical protein
LKWDITDGTIHDSSSLCGQSKRFTNETARRHKKM